MTTQQNPQPLTPAEYIALMQLLQTIAAKNLVPDCDYDDWKTIFAKLHYQIQNNDMLTLAVTLKKTADEEYCEMVDMATNKKEALGWEIKVRNGVFGLPELEAHKEIARKHGRHLSLMDTLGVVKMLLHPENYPENIFDSP